MSDHAKVRHPRHHKPWPVFIGFLQVIFGAVSVSRGAMDATGFILLLAGPTILLIAFRRYPGIAVAGVSAVTLGFLALGYPLGPVVPSAAAAAINAVIRGSRVAAWLSLLGIWLGWIALGLLELREFSTPLQELRGLGLAALLAALAELIDNRRQRAVAYRKLWAEERRRREEESQRRAGEERLLIARELHDVLAHSLSLITVRASVALELIDSNPGEVREALQAIKQASKSGLDDVRTVLHGLRAPEDAPRTPAPDLGRLQDLVAQAKAAGLTVTLAQTGNPGGIPAAAGLAGYRIVQEALTNVIRHSQAREAVVHVHNAAAAVLIGVSDQGPAQPKTSPDPAGSGLIGIQERAASLGGEALTGSTATGGFTVYAALPVNQDRGT